MANIRKQANRAMGGRKLSNIPLQPASMKEGVPYYRMQKEGLVQYIKFAGNLYFSNFERTQSSTSKKSSFSIDGVSGSYRTSEGFIIAWGKITLDSDVLTPFRFARVFPIQCFGVFLNSQLEDQNQTADAINITRTGFDINRTNGNEDITINYMAIGR